MKLWYYAQNSQRIGPIPEANLIEMLSSGQIDAKTLVWSQGLVNWTKACDVPGLAVRRTEPPPLPAASGAKAAEGEEVLLKKARRIHRMEVLSHIIDWTIFLVLIFVFDVDFWVALAVSVGAACLIRWAFCR